MCEIQLDAAQGHEQDIFVNAADGPAGRPAYSVVGLYYDAATKALRAGAPNTGIASNYEAVSTARFHAVWHPHGGYWKVLRIF